MSERDLGVEVRNTEGVEVGLRRTRVFSGLGVRGSGSKG